METLRMKPLYECDHDFCEELDIGGTYGFRLDYNTGKASANVAFGELEDKIYSDMIAKVELLYKIYRKSKVDSFDVLTLDAHEVMKNWMEYRHGGVADCVGNRVR